MIDLNEIKSISLPSNANSKKLILKDGKLQIVSYDGSIQPLVSNSVINNNTTIEKLDFFGIVQDYLNKRINELISIIDSKSDNETIVNLFNGLSEDISSVKSFIDSEITKVNDSITETNDNVSSLESSLSEYKSESVQDFTEIYSFITEINNEISSLIDSITALQVDSKISSLKDSLTVSIDSIKKSLDKYALKTDIPVVPNLIAGRNIRLEEDSNGITINAIVPTFVGTGGISRATVEEIVNAAVEGISGGSGSGDVLTQDLANLDLDLQTQIFNKASQSEVANVTGYIVNLIGSGVTGDTIGTGTKNITSNYSVVPSISGVYDLGSSTKPWKSLYLTNSTLYIDSVPVALSGSSLRIGNNLLATNSSVIHNTGNESISGTKTFTSPVTVSNTHFQTDTAYTVPNTTGAFGYSSNENALTYFNGTAFVHIGQELVVRVRNNTGSTIAAGKAVYINGALGNRPTVDLASNTTITSLDTIGVAAQDIPNNTDGYIVESGLAHDFDTSGFSDGDSLWLGTAGNIVNVRPVDPTRQIRIGYCIRSHVSLGKILVRVSPTGTLDELINVSVSGASNGDILQYNGSVWRNVSSSTISGNSSSTAASGISFSTTFGLTGTNVQSSLQEVFTKTQKKFGSKGPYKQETVVVLGDSWTDRTIQQGGVQNSLTYSTDLSASIYNVNGLPTSGNQLGVTSHFNWANIALNQRFKLLNDAGLTGDTLPGMLSRAPGQVDPFNPDWVILFGGINDSSSATSSNQIWTAWLNVYNYLNNKGYKIATATVPIQNGANTDAKRQYVLEFNDLLQRFCAANDIPCADYFSVMTDPVTGGLRSDLQSGDLVHMNQYGASLCGQELARVLGDASYPKMSRLPPTLSYYHVNNNPRLNGSNTSGISGFNLGTRCSGVGPDVTRLTIAGGSGTTTLSGSKVARTEYTGDVYRLTYVCDAGANNRCGIATEVQEISWSSGGSVSFGTAVAHRVITATGRAASVPVDYQVISSGSYGGTFSVGSDPTASWSTTLGTVFTDGSVRLRVVKAVIPGTTRLTARAAYRNYSVSGGTGTSKTSMFVLRLLSKEAGSNVILSSTSMYSTGSNPAGVVASRGVIETKPFQFPAGTTATGYAVELQVWGDPSTTTTFDLESLEIYIEE